MIPAPKPDNAVSERERVMAGHVATCQFCRKRTSGRWVVYRGGRVIGPKAHRDSTGRRCMGVEIPALIEPIDSIRAR